MFQFLDLKSLLNCDMVNKQWLNDARQPSSIYHLNIVDLLKASNNPQYDSSTILSRFKSVESLCLDYTCTQHPDTVKSLQNITAIFTKVHRMNIEIALYAAKDCREAAGLMIRELLSQNAHCLESITISTKGSHVGVSVEPYVWSYFCENNKNNVSSTQDKALVFPRLREIDLTDVNLFSFPRILDEKGLKTLKIRGNSFLSKGFWDGLIKDQNILSNIKIFRLRGVFVHESDVNYLAKDVLPIICARIAHENVERIDIFDVIDTPTDDLLSESTLVPLVTFNHLVWDCLSKEILKSNVSNVSNNNVRFDCHVTLSVEENLYAIGKITYNVVETFITPINSKLSSIRYILLDFTQSDAKNDYKYYQYQHFARYYLPIDIRRHARKMVCSTKNGQEGGVELRFILCLDEIDSIQEDVSVTSIGLDGDIERKDNKVIMKKNLTKKQELADFVKRNQMFEHFQLLGQNKVLSNDTATFEDDAKEVLSDKKPLSSSFAFAENDNENGKEKKDETFDIKDNKTNKKNNGMKQENKMGDFSFKFDGITSNIASHDEDTATSVFEWNYKPKPQHSQQHSIATVEASKKKAVVSDEKPFSSLFTFEENSNEKNKIKETKDNDSNSSNMWSFSSFGKVSFDTTAEVFELGTNESKTNASNFVFSSFSVDSGKAKEKENEKEIEKNNKVQKEKEEKRIKWPATGVDTRSVFVFDPNKDMPITKHISKISQLTLDVGGIVEMIAVLDLLQTIDFENDCLKYIKIEGLKKVVEDGIFTRCQALDKMKAVLFRIQETLDEKKYPTFDITFKIRIFEAQLTGCATQIIELFSILYSMFNDNYAKTSNHNVCGEKRNMNYYLTFTIILQMRKSDAIWKRLDENFSFESEWIKCMINGIKQIGKGDEVINNKTSNVIRNNDDDDVDNLSNVKSLPKQEISRLSRMCLDLPNGFVDISLRQTRLSLSKPKMTYCGTQIGDRPKKHTTQAELKVQLNVNKLHQLDTDVCK